VSFTHLETPYLTNDHTVVGWLRIFTGRAARAARPVYMLQLCPPARLPTPPPVPRVNISRLHRQDLFMSCHWSSNARDLACSPRSHPPLPAYVTVHRKPAGIARLQFTKRFRYSSCVCSQLPFTLPPRPHAAANGSDACDTCVVPVSFVDDICFKRCVTRLLPNSSCARQTAPAGQDQHFTVSTSGAWRYVAPQRILQDTLLAIIGPDRVWKMDS